MKIYKFRVLFDTNNEEDIFRDIEIKDTQNFDDLHEIIVASFGFDNSQMASFFLCNDNWEKEQEITLFDMHMESEQNTALTMSNCSIQSKILSKGQKLRYTYDFMNMKNFFIELIEVFTEDVTNNFFPKVSYSQGEIEINQDEENLLSNEEMVDFLLKNASSDEELDNNSLDVLRDSEDIDGYH